MKKPFSILTFLSISFFFSSCINDRQTVDFYTNLTAYEVSEEVQFDESWFEEDKKLVVASKSLHTFSLPFMDILKPYNLPVLIYIAVEDKEEIIAYLKKHDFKYPFIHDPNADFFEKNDLLEKLNMDRDNTVAAFFMKGNKNIERAQIGMRDLLKEQVEKFAEK